MCVWVTFLEGTRFGAVWGWACLKSLVLFPHLETTHVSRFTIHMVFPRFRFWVGPYPFCRLGILWYPFWMGRPLFRQTRTLVGHQYSLHSIAGAKWIYPLNSHDMAMGQNPVPPVNISLPTKTGKHGWCAYPKLVPLVLTHSHIPQSHPKARQEKSNRVAAGLAQV